MYKVEYDQFIKTGKLPATKSEKMVSPTQHFSEAYEGVLVKFQMRPGSTGSLYDSAVSVANNATKKQFPSLKLGGKWMDDGTILKIEKGQLNIGLGRGHGLDVFNENIVGYETLKVIRK